MNIDVDYIDTSGSQSVKSIYMSRLAFAKHMAIAGQRFAPKPKKLLRTIAMFLHYSYYIRRNTFYKNSFSQPPLLLSDPTEKSQFSNLAGKSIADFLSKRIHKSMFTINYEAAMKFYGFKVKGSRPDLIAFTDKAQFAIEAKGYSVDRVGTMLDYKRQAASGPILVNFSVASVSYNLYNKVECNYHDPYNQDIAYDDELVRSLTKKYYSGLSEFITSDSFLVEERIINGAKFYAVSLFPRLRSNLFSDECLFCYKVLKYLDLKLLLPTNIMELAENGINRQDASFSFESREENVYIDNDRVGLMVSNNFLF